MPDFVAIVQPSSVVGRASGEHWLGTLYARRVSPRISRRLIQLGITATATTVTMTAIGVLGAALIAPSSAWTAAIGAVLLQVHLVLDCTDGEIARWNGSTSAVGEYLDRLGHFIVDATAIVALGLHAQGDLAVGNWAYAGVIVAVLAMIAKSQTSLLAAVAPAPRGEDMAGDPPTTESFASQAKSFIARTRLHRMTGAIEVSLLVTITATADAIQGSLSFTRSLLIAVGIVAALLIPARAVAAIPRLRAVD